MEDKELEERARRFWKMLADAGVTTALMARPPEGSGVKATIHADGTLTAKDERDSEEKPIKVG